MKPFETVSLLSTVAKIDPIRLDGIYFFIEWDVSIFFTKWLQEFVILIIPISQKKTASSISVPVFLLILFCRHPATL